MNGAQLPPVRMDFGDMVASSHLRGQTHGPAQCSDEISAGQGRMGKPNDRKKFFGQGGRDLLHEPGFSDAVGAVKESGSMDCQQLLKLSHDLLDGLVLIRRGAGHPEGHQAGSPKDFEPSLQLASGKSG